MNRKNKIKFWAGTSVLSIVLMVMAVQVNAHSPPEYNDPQLNNSAEINNGYWDHMMRGYKGCH